jgi:hypothetical protein
MRRHYKSEKAAMRRVQTQINAKGIWAAIIRKYNVDGKVYYVLSFDIDDEV